MRLRSGGGSKKNQRKLRVQTSLMRPRSGGGPNDAEKEGRDLKPETGRRQHQ